MERLFESNHDVSFHICAAGGCGLTTAESAKRRPSTSSAKKRFEKIAEPGSPELELNAAAPIATPLVKSAAWLLTFPLGAWLKTAGPIPIGAELIVFFPLFRIAQNLVRFVDLLKLFFGGLFVLGHVWVILARQLAKRTANLFIARRFRDPECLVIISELYGHSLSSLCLRSIRATF